MRIDVLKKLKAISRSEWKQALGKCYSHLKLKLYGKIDKGAHCESRLGIHAFDFYTGQALTSLFEGKWNWDFGKFTIEEQLIRIIDSMISEQVRKYRLEVKNGGNPITYMDNQQITIRFENCEDDFVDKRFLDNCFEALGVATKDNETYLKFIELKRSGESYATICSILNCSTNEAYQIMETISRRAKKILSSLN